MKLTKKEVVATIKDMGLRCVWQSQWQEFYIDFLNAPKKYNFSPTAYFTNDPHDAIATAKEMRRRKTA